MGSEPISHLTTLLEMKGIHVLELDADDKFDGISGLVEINKDTQAAVVIKKKVSTTKAERPRPINQYLDKSNHLLLLINNALIKKI